MSGYNGNPLWLKKKTKPMERLLFQDLKNYYGVNKIIWNYLKDLQTLKLLYEMQVLNIRWSDNDNYVELYKTFNVTHNEFFEYLERCRWAKEYDK